MSATSLFFFGDDTFRSSQKLRALKARYRDASLGETNLVSLDGAAVTFEEFVRQVQALPFLAKSRLVVVTNLLLVGKKDLQESVAGYLAKVPESTVLVFYESGVPDRRTKLFKALKQPKLAEEFGWLVGAALARWISTRATELGLKLSDNLVSWLQSAVGSDLWRMDQELAKLASFAASSSEPLSEAVARELIHQDLKSDTFTLVDALVRGEGGRALAELALLLRRGEAPLAILGLITYQYRTLLLVAEAAAGTSTPARVAQITKIHPFVAQKLFPLARRAALAFWRETFTRLIAYDVALKTGALEADLALELLIGEFCSKNSKIQMTNSK